MYGFQRYPFLLYTLGIGIQRPYEILLSYQEDYLTFLVDFGKLIIIGISAILSRILNRVRHLYDDPVQLRDKIAAFNMYKIILWLLTFLLLPDVFVLRLRNRFGSWLNGELHNSCRLKFLLNLYTIKPLQGLLILACSVRTIYISMCITILYGVKVNKN